MTDMELLTLAEAARAHAYAPYSRYTVGAAALCRDGRVYTGCNIENASYGACLCAERAAVAAAVCDGNRELVKIAVTGSGEGLCTPCGICRQVIFEFSPDCAVICGHRHNPTELKNPLRQNNEDAPEDPAELLLGMEIYPIIKLLPSAFGADRLL